MPAPDEFFTPRTLAKKIRAISGGQAVLGEESIRRAVREGDLKAESIGRHRLIRWGWFMAWLGDRSTPSRKRMRVRGPRDESGRHTIGRLVHYENPLRL